MHLAFLTPEYPHPQTTAAAGIGTSIENMARALKKKGVKISVFVYSQGEDRIFTEEGIKFHLIKHRSYKYLGWYLYRKHLQHYLNKYIAVEKIDAVEAPDWTGITAFMKLRCPLVIRMNGSDTYFCNLEKRPQKKKNFFFEKRAIHRADHLLSVSGFTAKESARLFGINREISIIPNSVDAEKFTPTQQQPEPHSLLYFGSIIRKKGVLELGPVFNQIIAAQPGATLFIAGRDVIDLQTSLSTKALLSDSFSPEAGKRVKWLGVLPYEKVLDQIAKAQVVLLPSFAEALPMTWLEAMAMEKALVTSNIGWAKEVMKDGETGYTVDPKNHSAFSAKVLELLSNKELGQQMGKAARERVKEEFSAEVVAERNIEFYRKISS